MHLLLMFALLIWTQRKKDTAFYLFIGFVFLFGILVEWLGIHTGYLFGHYEYGTTLGIKWSGVPVLIGINWVMTIYCCGITIGTLLMKLSRELAAQSAVQPPVLKTAALIIDGATIAVVLDFLMEPVAIKLGYWKWLDAGEIPLYNYCCWFLISVVFLALFQYFRFPKQNKFAVHLLMIQVMFFLLLRTFLN